MISMVTRVDSPEHMVRELLLKRPKGLASARSKAIRSRLKRGVRLNVS
jgi:hypothetical protein